MVPGASESSGACEYLAFLGAGSFKGGGISLEKQVLLLFTKFNM